MLLSQLAINSTFDSFLSGCISSPCCCCGDVDGRLDENEPLVRTFFNSWCRFLRLVPCAEDVDAAEVDPEDLKIPRENFLSKVVEKKKFEQTFLKTLL